MLHSSKTGEREIMELQLAHTFRSIMQMVFRTVLAIFLSGPTAGLFAAAATEGVSFALTRQFPGQIATHLLAVGFFLVVGYSVALTYAVVESVRGALRLSQLLEHELLHPEQMIQRRVREMGQNIARR